MENSENYYSNVRTDLFVRLKSNQSLGRTLDIGCGEGVTSLYMREKGLSSYTVGVDLYVENKVQAESNLDEFHNTSIEDFLQTKPELFDTIIMADVLEHLVDPWEIFERVVEKLLKPGGMIIVSLPNARSFKFLGKIFYGSFEYEDFGIFDRTHLRFFCRNDMVKLVDLRNTQNIRIFSKTFLEPRFFKRRVLVNLSLGILKDFLTDQYIIYVHKTE